MAAGDQSAAHRALIYSHEKTVIDEKDVGGAGEDGQLRGA